MNKKTCDVYVINTKKYNFSNYTYLVKDRVTSEALIVDPSWQMDKIEKLIETTDSKVKKILLTHTHYDHVNLVADLTDKYQLQVYASDREVIHYKFKCKNLNLVQHNEEVVVGNINVKCILTPGHTAGSMCYRIEDNLFTGDTVFGEGCGICSLNGGSARDMFYSFKYLKEKIPTNVKVFPGHSYGKTPGCLFQDIIRDNIYFQIDNLDMFVKFRLRMGQKNLFDFK